MKTSNKILAFLLASIMLVSVFAVGFTSFAATKTIDRVDITLRTDIAGLTRKDYKTIFTINTKNVTYDDKRPNFPYAIESYKAGASVQMSTTEKFVKDNNYDIKVWVAAAYGYAFSSNAKVYINGKLAVTESSPSDGYKYLGGIADGINVTEATEPTEDPERSFFDKIKDFFSGIIASILEFFGSLFNR